MCIVAHMPRIAFGSDHLLKKTRSSCEFAAKIMPSRLSGERENHVNTCQGLQKRLETDPEFLSKMRG
jgi:hypothetical protein